MPASRPAEKSWAGAGVVRAGVKRIVGRSAGASACEIHRSQGFSDPDLNAAEVHQAFQSQSTRARVHFPVSNLITTTTTRFVSWHRRGQIVTLLTPCAVGEPPVPVSSQ